VFYTEETVYNLQQNFFKKNYHIGSTVNHNGILDKESYIFESWIVQDPERDKATLLGLDVKKGDWVLGQKIEDPKEWQKVKNKEITGFSIEAYLEPVLINNNVEMTKEEIDERIKRVLMESQLGTKYTIEDKDFYIDKLEVGGKVTDGDGNPIPNGEMEIEKMKIKTDENGVITEAVTEVENEEEEPAPTEDKTAELQKLIDEKDVEINDLKAKISELEAGKTEMSAEVEAAKKVALEMAEEMKKGIKPEAKEKKYEEMSNKEKALYNRGKL
jgi:hypothetical protein